MKTRKPFRSVLSILLALTIAISLPTGAFAEDGNKSDKDQAVPLVKLESLKVVEILTSASTGYIGRNAVANGTYPESDRGKVRPGSDNLTTNSISRPRELDDYHLTGIYGTAGVPYDISEVLLTNGDADNKYPGVPKYQALAKEISDEVYTGLTEGNGVFVVGSSCAPGVGIAGGIRHAYGDDVKIGIIYLDAHGDVNTKASTFSGSMGGMDLAAIVGLDQEEWWQAACGGVMKPLDASLHTCGRNLDSGVDPITGPFGEMLNLQQAGTNVVTVEGFNDEENWREQVKALADNVDVIYVQLDADALDNAFIPNVNTPEPNGPDIWTMMRNLKIIMDTDKVAVVELASIFFGRSYETNKTRLETMQGFKFPDIAGETPAQATNRASQISILSGIRMICTMFENWDYMPELVKGDKSQLTKTIADAKQLMNSVKVSADGSDVTGGDYWVTQNINTSYNNAIGAAETFIQNNPKPSAGALQQAIAALNAATEAFEDAMTPGSKVEPKKPAA